MNIKHRTYNIKDNDTIESIARSLRLDVEELKDYHNSKSHLDHRILFSIPGHLTTLVIPPKGFILKNGKEVWDGEDEKPVSIKLAPSGKLYNVPVKGDICYGVFKTIQSGKNINTIKYNVSIRFYPKSEKGNIYISIDIISKTYINKKEPELIAEELALACTEALYPIVLQIDTNGLLIGVQNHNAILKRWEKQKAKNLKYYKGETAEKYFQLFEETLLEKNTLFNFLQNDWFFQLYFNKIYETYTNNYELERTLEFPIVPNTKSVQFYIRQEIDAYLKNNRIQIELKGKCTDPRSKSDIENGNYFPSINVENIKPVTGDYRALYFLHPKTKKIESALLQCNLNLKEEKNIFISISRIKDKKASRRDYRS